MKRVPTKTIIVVAGPTAVGKTAVGIQFAKHFNTGIISADSRQCFRELTIGVARPSAQELASIPHYFIASHSIHDKVSAITFEQYALEIAGKLFQQKDKILLVGGTGLYIKALLEGLDAIPEIDPAIRQRILEAYEQQGMDWLTAEIGKKDPDFFEKGEVQNPQRSMRALEVMEATGRSILSFQKNEKRVRDFEVIKIGLELPREELIRNINHRVNKMIESGLVEEVKQLWPYRTLNALQTVGYTEIFDYLDGKLSLDEAMERIRINTRQYAKRQMTWFRKDKDFKWVHPSEAEAMINWVASKT